MRLEILKSGLIESDAQVMELAERYGRIIMPNENEDLELTHWWLIRDDGTEILYVGTLETLASFTKEKDGKVDLAN
jgi:hypothetical protein